jgi:hypothetical protein
MLKQNVTFSQTDVNSITVYAKNIYPNHTYEITITPSVGTGVWDVSYNDLINGFKISGVLPDTDYRIDVEDTYVALPVDTIYIHTEKELQKILLTNYTQPDPYSVIIYGTDLNPDDEFIIAISPWTGSYPKATYNDLINGVKITNIVPDTDYTINIIDNTLGVPVNYVTFHSIKSTSNTNNIFPDIIYPPVDNSSPDIIHPPVDNPFPVITFNQPDSNSVIVHAQNLNCEHIYNISISPSVGYGTWDVSCNDLSNGFKITGLLPDTDYRIDIEDISVTSPVDTVYFHSKNSVIVPSSSQNISLSNNKTLLYIIIGLIIIYLIKR